ncbi:MAG TPA: DUF6235 family protein [Actinophytocola sp.]|jgi:hypothetical protein|uniref:DUF6235 family protein n=1 Tax=Actinophytocola sp. TaxID=1872138 RepID=UPI002F94C94E
MNRQPESVGRAGQQLFRMDTGMDVLESWAPGASQSAKDAVYAALFAMTDRSLVRDHRVVEDGMELSEFFVLLRDDLVLKLRVHCYDSFGVVYVGPRAGAPGLADDKAA